MNPSKFSLASIAILQQSASQLEYSVSSVLRHTTEFRNGINSIKDIYTKAYIQNKMKDGHLTYPHPENGSEAGMGFELRNASFAYPGSKLRQNALKDISLSISPGQLVVIVGANGSGKSTIIKLFCRLYAPHSGDLFIDGIPAEDYISSELREASTILSQENLLYPLSLGENIGLGYWEKVMDTELISQAAKKGGASHLLSKLSEGMQTVLEPENNIWSRNFSGIPDHPLHQTRKNLSSNVDLSGGEKQRIAASRTFMRLFSEKVKFVAVDEPSSALDPEGELQLFERLIAARKGKTMVFVTHRFGHLTKHADKIICMKDGSIVEQGSHKELMKLSGEYAKLYSIQARAFESTSPGSA
ncbi:P-loop containing nucleoside triphosphate hydrolase protein [Crucibulum laeve]|uniref:P-loop containing nucleoside triphosphate hydrolase protein n=1 Tax=Crucibulum laeve TaxID=68775 RepID=A0A5C3LNG1_9AGAR|nr:P-loop containing nucleoside triphosphate hydrolase protein [Crucibulum laeve]